MPLRKHHSTLATTTNSPTDQLTGGPPTPSMTNSYDRLDVESHSIYGGAATPNGCNSLLIQSLLLVVLGLVNRIKSNIFSFSSLAINSSPMHRKCAHVRSTYFIFTALDQCNADWSGPMRTIILSLTKTIAMLINVDDLTNDADPDQRPYPSLHSVGASPSSTDRPLLLTSTNRSRSPAATLPNALHALAFAAHTRSDLWRLHCRHLLAPVEMIAFCCSCGGDLGCRRRRRRRGAGLATAVPVGIRSAPSTTSR